MSRTLINPNEMYPSLQYGFSHAAASSASTRIHCAGQVAWDSGCELVGEGDLAVQTARVLENIACVLAAAGATRQDVVRIRTYVVDHTPDKLGIIVPELMRFFGEAACPPNTLVGVAALALPGFLIEIEADAEID